MTNSEFNQVAAVDLGSNSFHMIVMQMSEGRLQVVDKIKESIRLADGLDDKNRLTEEAMNRAIACLERFGQRIKEMPAGSVRVVGTNTLRKAKNSRKFITRAEQAIGHPIDVIAGREEARLIYLGVSHSLEDNGQRRLVMDIGGGSTEFIIGMHFEPERTESLHMGCVVFSKRFFRDGVISHKAMRQAEIAALVELESIEKEYRKAGWDLAIGASGSILAIHEVVTRQGWSNEGITPASMTKLKDALLSAGHVDKLKLDGLAPDRAAIFPGGVAILSAAFEALKIERMQVSDGALREGAIYDLLGRIRKEDVRESTVEALEKQYRINSDQAGRVEKNALDFLSQAGKKWKLSNAGHAQRLRWAARLHEIGIAISYSLYHKHGYYLLSNLDMPGFSRGDQQLLATIVRGHRRKFPRAEFALLPSQMRKPAKKLCILLRLAVVLHRSQSDSLLPEITLKVDNLNISMQFPDNWLVEHPLTQADLEQEAAYLLSAGYHLSIS